MVVGCSFGMPYASHELFKPQVYLHKFMQTIEKIEFESTKMCMCNTHTDDKKNMFCFLVFDKVFIAQ